MFNEPRNFSKLSFKRKKAQEEMIGFAIIIVLVSVILLAFLGFSLSHSSSEKVQSYEVEGFLYSSLQFTTSCDGYNSNLSLQKLIFQCYSKRDCLSGGNPCEILNETLKGILNASWPIYDNNSLYKGYAMNIWEENNKEMLFSLDKENATKNYKWASQDFSKNRDKFHIEFKAYY